MSLRRLLLSTPVVLALAAPSGAVADGEAEPAFESLSLMHAVGTLAIEADGHVGAVQLDTKVQEALRAPIEHAVASLRFKPVLVGGVAQRTRTAFDVALAARPAAVGTGYDLSIDGIRFHPVKGATISHTDDESYDVVADGKFKPPVYPRDAMRNRAMGRVVLALRFNADGHVEDTAIVAEMLYDTGVRPAVGRRSLAQFEQAALAVARGWHAKVIPGTRPPGPGGYIATTAVVFTLSETVDLDKDGQWLPVQRLPNRAIPWLPAREGKPAFDDDGSVGGFLALGGGGPQLERSEHGTPIL